MCVPKFCRGKKIEGFGPAVSIHCTVGETRSIVATKEGGKEGGGGRVCGHVFNVDSVLMKWS